MDFAIAKFLNHLGLGVIDSITIFISSDTFLFVLWTSITLIILFFDKNNGKKIFLAVAVAVIFHFIITIFLLKHALAGFLYRPRPYLAHPGEIIPLGPNFSDSSFPSGHMSSTLAILTVYFHYYQKYWPLMLLFALFMAFARIHNGMHYPSDILAGAVLGIIYGLVAIYIANKYEKAKK